MKTVSAGLNTHYGQPGTTVALLIRVTRTDGFVLGLTSHDRTIQFTAPPAGGGSPSLETIDYKPGFSSAALQSRVGLSVDNSEVLGILDSDLMTEAELDAGVWDHSQIHVFEVNYEDTSQGSMKQLRGWVGEITWDVDRQKYRAEVHSLASKLNKSIGETVGPACAASVGDTRCKVDLTEYTAAGEVTAVTDDRTFDTDLATAIVRLSPTSTGTPTSGYFDAGLLTWITGDNAPRSAEVKTYAIDGELVLQLQQGFAVQVGDTFDVSIGCTKARDFCQTVFDNVVNFRGFPDLPGLDKVLRTGGQ